MYYHYIFTSSFFFDTRFLRSICTDLLQTLPYDVCSWAIENISCKFSYVPLKEIRGKTHCWRFLGHYITILQYHSVLRTNFKRIPYNIGFHSLCVRNLLEGETYSRGERLVLLVIFSVNKKCVHLNTKLPITRPV